MHDWCIALLALNHATSQACTCIACGLGVKVVRVGVHDQAFAQDVAIAFAQHELGGVKLHNRQTIGIGAQAGQIAYMVAALAVLAVCTACRVEVTARAVAIGAAAIALFVDVKAVL